MVNLPYPHPAPDRHLRGVNFMMLMLQENYQDKRPIVGQNRPSLRSLQIKENQMRRQITAGTDIKRRNG